MRADVRQLADLHVTELIGVVAYMEARGRLSEKLGTGTDAAGYRIAVKAKTRDLRVFLMLLLDRGGDECAEMADALIKLRADEFYRELTEPVRVKAA
jgi:hypothetical protein